MATESINYEYEGRVYMVTDRRTKLILPYKSQIEVRRDERLRINTDFGFDSVTEKNMDSGEEQPVPKLEIVDIILENRAEIDEIALLDSTISFVKNVDRAALTELTDVPLDLGSEAVSKETERRKSVLNPRLVTEILLELNFDFTLWTHIRRLVNVFILKGKVDNKDAQSVLASCNHDEQVRVAHALGTILRRYKSATTGS